MFASIVENSHRADSRLNDVLYALKAMAAYYSDSESSVNISSQSESVILNVEKLES